MLFVRETLHKAIHIEGIQLTIALLLLRRSAQVLTVREQQARKTTDESGTDTIRMESLGTHERNEAKASAMGSCLAAGASIDSVSLRVFVANAACCCRVPRSPVKAMTLDPDSRLRVMNRMDLHAGHDS